MSFFKTQLAHLGRRPCCYGMSGSFLRGSCSWLFVREVSTRPRRLYTLQPLGIGPACGLELSSTKSAHFCAFAVRATARNASVNTSRIVIEALMIGVVIIFDLVLLLIGPGAVIRNFATRKMFVPSGRNYAGHWVYRDTAPFRYWMAVTMACTVMPATAYYVAAIILDPFFRATPYRTPTGRSSLSTVGWPPSGAPCVAVAGLVGVGERRRRAAGRQGPNR